MLNWKSVPHYPKKVLCYFRMTHPLDIYIKLHPFMKKKMQKIMAPTHSPSCFEYMDCWGDNTSSPISTLFLVSPLFMPHRRDLPIFWTTNGWLESVTALPSKAAPNHPQGFRDSTPWPYLALFPTFCFRHLVCKSQHSVGSLKKIIKFRFKVWIFFNSKIFIFLFEEDVWLRTPCYPPSWNFGKAILCPPKGLYTITSFEPPLYFALKKLITRQNGFPPFFLSSWQIFS